VKLRAELDHAWAMVTSGTRERDHMINEHARICSEYVLVCHTMSYNLIDITDPLVS
jgi:hypothetical protein